MPTPKKLPISAIVVAAGLSTRMGQPKQLLPYGPHTVIEQVVHVLLQGGLADILVITGHERLAIEAKLAAWPVRLVFNPNYEQGEMLSSVQTGLTQLDPATRASLIVLSDQPQLEVAVIHQLMAAYQAGSGRWLIPSFNMRRGHPILIDQLYWPEILALTSDQTLRDVMKAHTAEIHYVIVETDTVLRDMDTPEAYQRIMEERGERMEGGGWRMEDRRWKIEDGG